MQISCRKTVCEPNFGAQLIFHGVLRGENGATKWGLEFGLLGISDKKFGKVS